MITAQAADGSSVRAFDEGHGAALVRAIGQPMVIVGHSSGAVLALEALVATPTAYAGAVLYEPPCVIGPPLGGEALARAQAAIAAGKPVTALAIFLREIVRAPAWMAVVALSPRIRRMARHQIDDC